MIVTLNWAIEEWYSMFPDNLMASKVVDRALNHAQLVEMKGHSFRNPPSMRAIKEVATF